MFNKVILIGRLTADPELKQTQSGTNVCSFRIAVNRRFSPDKADFINIVAWKNTAEFVSRYFTKGNVIGVEGELQNREYTDRDGNKRTISEVVASGCFFTGGKGETKGPEIPADFSPVAADDDPPF